MIINLKSSMFDEVDVRLPDVSVVMQSVQESIPEHKKIRFMI